MAKRPVILISGSYWPPHVDQILGVVKHLHENGQHNAEILVSVADAKAYVIPTKTTEIEVIDSQSSYAEKRSAFDQYLGDFRKSLIRAMLRSMQGNPEFASYHALLSRVRTLPQSHDGSGAGQLIDQFPSDHSPLIDRVKEGFIGSDQELCYTIGAGYIPDVYRNLAYSALNGANRLKKAVKTKEALKKCILTGVVIPAIESHPSSLKYTLQIPCDYYVSRRRWGYVLY